MKNKKIVKTDNNEVEIKCPFIILKLCLNASIALPLLWLASLKVNTWNISIRNTNKTIPGTQKKGIADTTQNKLKRIHSKIYCPALLLITSSCAPRSYIEDVLVKLFAIELIEP